MITKTKTTALVGGALAAMLVLTACGEGATEVAEVPGTGTGTAGAGQRTEITWAGWDPRTGLEFISLTDGFNATNLQCEIYVVDYMTTGEYRTALTADLAAGTAPDILTLIDVPHFVTLSNGNQLLNIDDIVAAADPATASLDLYVSQDGHFQAVPMRQDFWILYYNVDYFEQAGIPLPTQAYTWDEFQAVAQQLTDNLPAGITGNYQHHWASTVNAFAAVQTPGADLFGGDFSYLAPFYERSLEMQADGLQPTFATVTTGSLHHRAEFGNQRAAMVNMGTWFMSQILDTWQTGEAEPFNWAIMPVPQYDASTVNAPITFGTPTGLAINQAIPADHLDCAKQFLAFAVGEAGARALASVGMVPPLLNDEIVDIIFAIEGMPQDELSKRTFLDSIVREQNPVSPNLPIVDSILNDLHSEVMTVSTPIETAIQNANERFAREAVN